MFSTPRRSAMVQGRSKCLSAEPSGPVLRMVMNGLVGICSSGGFGFGNERFEELELRLIGTLQGVGSMLRDAGFAFGQHKSQAAQEPDAIFHRERLKISDGLTTDEGKELVAFLGVHTDRPRYSATLARTP